MAPLLASNAITPGPKWFYLMGLGGLLWAIGNILAIHKQRQNVGGCNDTEK
jgi:hypothetical protein